MCVCVYVCEVTSPNHIYSEIECTYTTNKMYNYMYYYYK